MKRRRTILCEGKYKRLICENGWEYVERVRCGGIVVVLAETDRGKIILIDQVRIPVGKKVIEFPAGLANDRDDFSEESPEEAARREFLEETGYEAREMRFVASGPANPAISADIMMVFHAKGIRKMASGGGDGTESITVHEVDARAVETWLEEKKSEGYLVDPKVYAGLYFLNKFREKSSV
ncbi:MAG TPA: NUDIX hydrolase [Candidatus Omnitrophota bacterium]|nr:NUDIX hydrolase [Candidatus Omnitrophota bacterium]